jgi:hypothetical protein
MNSSITTLTLFSFLLLLLTLAEAADYQLKQVGPKISLPIQVSGDYFGNALSMNYDGTRAVVGSFKKDSATGGAYVFSNNGSQWVLESSNLIGSDVQGTAGETGYSVAISGDGQIVAVSAHFDNDGRGAWWSYIFNGTAWNQQGLKHTGNSCSNSICGEGSSIALNFDGSIAAVGSVLDDSFAGSAFIYRRSGSTWTQIGNKLSPTGATSTSYMGSAISLSYDGLTVLCGAYGDNAQVGAAFVFYYNVDLQQYFQQGSKLKPYGITGAYSNFGQSVSLSADGQTALIGAPEDNQFAGAVYIFQKVSNLWWQRGSKIVASNPWGTASTFGSSVQLNAQATRAIVGGYQDNLNIGATWWLVLDSVDGNNPQYKMVGFDCLAEGFIGQQGTAVAMNGEGDMLLVGGVGDNGNSGAMWQFQATVDETTLTLAKLLADNEVLNRKIQLISPPSRSPSKKPTTKPSKAPSKSPSKAPKSTKPSKTPSHAPSKAPKFSKPSKSPSLAPTKKVVG